MQTNRLSASTRIGPRAQVFVANMPKIIAKYILGVHSFRYRIRTSGGRDFGYKYYFGLRRVACICLTIGTGGKLESSHWKAKVKVAFWSFFNIEAIFGLLYSCSQQVPAFISRGAMHHTDARDLYQRRRELLQNFASKFEFTEIC